MSTLKEFIQCHPDVGKMLETEVCSITGDLVVKCPKNKRRGLFIWKDEDWSSHTCFLCSTLDCVLVRHACYCKTCTMVNMWREQIGLFCGK